MSGMLEIFQCCVASRPKNPPDSKRKKKTRGKKKFKESNRRNKKKGRKRASTESPKVAPMGMPRMMDQDLGYPSPMSSSPISPTALSKGSDIERISLGGSTASPRALSDGTDEKEIEESNTVIIRFDLERKMGFVISHHLHSTVVHVAKVHEGGQGKEKGVQVGWIIRKVDTQIIGRSKIHHHASGVQRTKTVERIVQIRKNEYRTAKSQFDEAKGEGQTKAELEEKRWINFQFLIPEEAKDEKINECARLSVSARRNTIKFAEKAGPIKIMYAGDISPRTQTLADLPKIPTTVLIKKNRGFGKDHTKHVQLHKFAVYYSLKQLSETELEDYDQKIEIEGERSKLTRETVCVPLPSVIDAKVSRKGTMLILNLSDGETVLTFMRPKGSQVDLWEWADAINKRKEFYWQLNMTKESQEKRAFSSRPSRLQRARTSKLRRPVNKK
ncbi:hypothetical protein AAMO2058_001735100 [Amorphochlora amoebiformis]